MVCLAPLKGEVFGPAGYVVERDREETAQDTPNPAALNGRRIPHENDVSKVRKF